MEKVKSFFRGISFEMGMSTIWFILAMAEVLREDSSTVITLLCLTISTLFSVTHTIKEAIKEAIKEEIQNAKK